MLDKTPILASADLQLQIGASYRELGAAKSAPALIMIVQLLLFLL
jgi:hypothetical protein